MGLLSRDDLARNFLDGAERQFEAQVTRLTADVDNLIANSVGIDDHARIDNALHELFEKLAAERDGLETVREFRRMRQL
jgi:hypothetical protein